MSNSEPDRLRLAVYRAEDQWSATIDRGGHVDFFGSQIIAPVQLRFGDITAVQDYVDQITRLIEVPALRVRHRKGGTRAHFERHENEAVIAIPSDQPWAMRESVVLHEIAHHVCVLDSGNTKHDHSFVSTMLILVERQLGPEAALLLRTGYQAGGVPI